MQRARLPLIGALLAVAGVAVAIAVPPSLPAATGPLAIGLGLGVTLVGMLRSGRGRDLATTGAAPSTPAADGDTAPPESDSAGVSEPPIDAGPATSTSGSTTTDPDPTVSATVDAGATDGDSGTSTATEATTDSTDTGSIDDLDDIFGGAERAATDVDDGADDLLETVDRADGEDDIEFHFGDDR